MKNLIVLSLSFALLLSSAIASAQGKGNAKDKDFKINKGQVNSTIRKETNPGNAGLLDDKAGKKDNNDKKDKDDKKDEDDKQDKDSQLEKSIKKESRKAVKKAIK